MIFSNTKGEIPQLATCTECLPDNVHNAQNGEDGQVKYLQCSQLCSQFLQEYWKDDVHNAQNGKNRQVTLVMFMIIFKTGKMDRWNC